MARIHSQFQHLEIQVDGLDELESAPFSRSNSVSSTTRPSVPKSPSGSSSDSSRFLKPHDQAFCCHGIKNGMAFLSLLDDFINWLTRKTGKRRGSYQRRKRAVRAVGMFFGLFFLVNFFILAKIQRDKPGVSRHVSHSDSSSYKAATSIPHMKTTLKNSENFRRPRKGTFDRLLALASHALSEDKREPKDLWQEPYVAAASWKPCADLRTWEPNSGNNGFVMITANGGINQQRVAVCNAVVLARLLNSTLVIPKFMYSSVWRDTSQFSDIYQEDHFMDYLSRDIQIVKELPDDLKNLDLNTSGSVFSDVDVQKESEPSFYLKSVLPILLKNKVVHFVGFGNRLAFDPLPFQLQRLRCRCNFYALQFVPKIQEAGALLLDRLRKGAGHPGPLDRHLLGRYSEPRAKNEKFYPMKNSRYLAVHLRFEIDMVAHSLCEYGGGEEEKRELEEYRKIHFPALAMQTETDQLPSALELRAEGLCPLSPEEAVLMLAALGFKRKTHIFVAGASTYGGASRLTALTSLYPHLVTKEKLLSPAELQPFKNFSSQLAALDFIGCSASDVFAMTDSGSQLSSLVSGYRIYFGEGKMTTIRPNKRRLADIFRKNSTIEWRVFEQRVRKAVRQTKHVFQRPKGRSIYRYPRCKECMCFAEGGL